MYNTKGSITVFLSLVLSTVLCFVLTLTELARCYLVSVWTNRAVTLALDSVMAEFYDPLFSEYHLMALDLSYQTDQLQEKLMLEKATNYQTNALFAVNKGQIQGKDRRGDLLGVTSVQNVALHRTFLSSREGEYMIRQASDYMLAKGASNLCESILTKLSVMEPDHTTMKVLEEKTELDTELSELDLVALELIELYDGPKTKKTGIEISKEGVIKVQEHFVKQLLPTEATAEAVSIDHTKIFEAIRPYYLNYGSYFATQCTLCQDYLQIEQEKAALEVEYSKLKTSEEQIVNTMNALEQERSNLLIMQKEAEGEGNPNKEGGETDELKAIMAQLEANSCALSAAAGEMLCVQNSKQENYIQQKRKEEQMESILKGLLADHQEMKNSIEAIKKKNEKAIKKVEEIQSKLTGIGSRVREYQELLKSSSGEIDAELFTTLKEECNELHKNVGQVYAEDSKYQTMLVTLRKNVDVLEQVQLSLEEICFEPDTVLEDKSKLYTSWEMLMEYQTNGLSNDYSRVNFSADEEGYSSLKGILEQLSGGLASLVINQKECSEKQIDLNTVFSRTDFLVQGQETVNQNFEQDLFQSDTSARLSGTFETASGYQGKEFTKELIEKISTELLFSLYLEEHFADYLTNKESTTRDIRCLEYEMEYLLCGKETDLQNLNSIINRLVLVRFIGNLVPAIANTKLRQEALVLATSFFSFTGMPFLIKAVQYLIIIACTYLEALIDTSALLLNKQLPIIKRPAEFSTHVSDLLQFSPSYIKSQAKKMKSGSGLTAVSYTDYLRFFILCSSNKSLSKRALDLMELNLRAWYDDSFRMKHCIIGVMMKTTVEFSNRITLWEGLYPKEVQIQKNQGKGYTYENLAFYEY